MQKHKSCSFFGTRSVIITEEMKIKINNKVLELLKSDFRIFYFGGFSEFDIVCHKVVSEYKKDFPDIYRIFCASDIRWLRVNKRPKWLSEQDYEEIIYLDIDYDYWYSRIYYRNCEIINRSEFVLFFATENNESGAYKALKYAKLKKKDFVNLLEESVK